MRDIESILIECLENPEWRRNLEGYFEVVCRIGNRIREEERRRLEGLTDQERTAYKFICTTLELRRSPSIREITQALGLKSSRSGHQVVQRLIRKKLIHRDKLGQLGLDN